MSLMNSIESMNYAFHTGKNDGIHKEIVINSLPRIIELPKDKLDSVQRWVSTSKDNAQNKLSDIITNAFGEKSTRLVK